MMIGQMWVLGRFSQSRKTQGCHWNNQRLGSRGGVVVGPPSSCCHAYFAAAKYGLTTRMTVFRIRSL